MKIGKRNTYIIIVLFAVSVLMFIRYLNTSGLDGFKGSGADSFTLYYAEWCPHCKTIKPVFKKWSDAGTVSINGKTVFVSMVEVEKEPEKAKGKPVKGFPTFLLETGDGQFKEFDGDRSPAGWEAWLSKNLS